MTTFLLVLLAIETVALASSIVMYKKLKKASLNRRVEAPNSSYKSQYVVDLEVNERWEQLDLSLLHEVNREEVEKLLLKVRTSSVKALPSHERAFLERMADAHDIVLAESKRKKSSEAPASARHAPGT